MLSEVKYDGERLQVHKMGSDFRYYSRSLKPVLPHKVSVIEYCFMCDIHLWYVFLRKVLCQPVQSAIMIIRTGQHIMIFVWLFEKLLKPIISPIIVVMIMDLLVILLHSICTGSYIIFITRYVSLTRCIFLISGNENKKN